MPLAAAAPGDFVKHHLNDFHLDSIYEDLEDALREPPNCFGSSLRT